MVSAVDRVSSRSLAVFNRFFKARSDIPKSAAACAVVLPLAINRRASIWVCVNFTAGAVSPCMCKTMS